VGQSDHEAEGKKSRTPEGKKEEAVSAEVLEKIHRKEIQFQQKGLLLHSNVRVAGYRSVMVDW
jgi:hypothetical protein